MKIVLKILCILTALYCIYFPFSYFNGAQDKKEVKASHILVETEQEAIDLKKQIEEGKISFEDVAKNHSLCPSSEYGGDLGFNEKGRLDKDFEKVMFSLKKRIISDPIKTKAGWHLAKVYEIKYFSDKENFSLRYAISTEEAIKLLNK